MIVLHILFYLYLGAFCIQACYYLFLFTKLAFYQAPKAAAQEQKPVSVVVCARNEATNLQKNLPLLLQQDYPDFEVVVVNDRSEDETPQVLEKFKAAHPHLKVVTLTAAHPHLKGKKHALTKGIEVAQHDLLLLTDADCHPASKQWIHHMENAFVPAVEVVFGYGPIEKAPGWLNFCVRFETFMTALQYLTYALAGMPYMGVGRNLAYRKAQFHENPVLGEHPHLQSGDDDLFINRIANKSNTAVVLSPETFQYSAPEQSWSAWIRQKKRHISTGKYYRFHHQVLLGGFAASHFLFYLCFILLLIGQFHIDYVLLVLLGRWSLQYAIFHPSMQKLGERDLILLTPVLDLSYLILNLLLVPSALLNKKVDRWK